MLYKTQLCEVWFVSHVTAGRDVSVQGNSMHDHTTPPRHQLTTYCQATHYYALLRQLDFRDIAGLIETITGISNFVSLHSRSNDNRFCSVY